jgi:predicted transcriptional regulator
MTTASGLLPVRGSTAHEPGSVRIPLQDAAPVVDVLASDTARSMLGLCAAHPMPTSALADAVGTSTQNATHHVGNLHEAGLLETVDTWYSVKGREMDVHAARYGTVVLCVA